MPSSRLKSRWNTRLEGERAEAGPAEHALDHDRAAEQRAELHADEAHHRQDRVAQHVA